MESQLLAAVDRWLAALRNVQAHDAAIEAAFAAAPLARPTSRAMRAYSASVRRLSRATKAYQAAATQVTRERYYDHSF